MTLFPKWILANAVLLLICFTSQALAEDPWQGLEDPLDAKVGDAKESELPSIPDLDEKPKALAEAPKPAAAPAAASETHTNPLAVEPLKKTPEEEIQEEYDAYVERQERERREDDLRQRVFHEGAKNAVSLDYIRNDLANVNYGNGSDRNGDTIGAALGLHHYILNTNNLGRLAFGAQAELIGTATSKLHFRNAYVTMGPRLTYELKFLVGQLLVPVGIGGWDHVYNAVGSIPSTATNATFHSGNFSTWVYGVGLLINLNRFDSHTGTSALVSTGIKKFDLATIYMIRSGQSEDRSSSSFNLGLRFEY